MTQVHNDYDGPGDWMSDWFTITEGFTNEQHEALSRMLMATNRAGRYQGAYLGWMPQEVSVYDVPEMYQPANEMIRGENNG